MLFLATAIIAASIGTVQAQVGGYGQCGGSGYSGSTSCTSGYYCTSQNPYYYQCVPGTATATTTSTTKSTSSTTKATTTTTKGTTTVSATTLTTTTKTASQTSTSAATAATCTGTFSAISASDFVANLHPGWNLGNTLDATPDEGSWNNAAVVASTFSVVKEAGFKSVRIPVTYAYHFTGSSPDWTIDPDWLQRVSDVVDMVTSLGLYAIVDAHHDSWIWADVTASGANITMIEEKFYRLWYQVGTKLACKSSLVAFEPINEPPCNDADDGAEINNLNKIFLQAINDAGGFNSQRVVTLVGGGEDSIKTSEWFVAPSGFSNPYAIQFHYYSPYDFIFSAWGKTIWGSDADKATVLSDFTLLRNNFTNVPILLGEYDASPTNTEPAARWKYVDYLIRSALGLDISCVLWDNGLDHLDRNAGTWRDPNSISMIVDSTASTANSLPDSTEDSSATSQWSSAYIFHQYGTSVSAQSLPFIFNGNTLTSISDSSGSTLTSGTDYSVSGSNITFTASYLSKHVSSTTSPGVIANLTLKFSGGASSPVVQLVQWKAPTLSSTTAVASSVSGSDLYIPITWGGLSTIAAVKAVTTSGTYLVDDWTVYLGNLQQARTTYSSQYNWDSSDVIITSSAISSVISAGVSTVFTFEFYPRTGVTGNAVNFTLTV
ncbi:Immunoglobulin E-set [Penicillium macrosclerotiorum]|uniref:Immunoglobulin E-set n=1 Tax=Penicillium macrosclerotiorum TaxID=303699 RepID=UPI0025497B48|nr:Immunoglobulin E-set [Penicillium macrosclerotiorum]KAJ5688863.1 Immunoglobulin E-set [Penicillium macrosclerotiorum]